MKITQIIVYPIKSLRGISLPSTILCAQGLTYDRRYILLKPLDNGTYEQMFVGIQTEMALFHCKLLSPSSFEVEYHIPDPPVAPANSCQNTKLEIPFEPKQSCLERINIKMHLSSAYPAYRMPYELNAWFSDCFGYQVILAYMGDGLGTSLQNEKTQAWLPTIKPALQSANATINFSDTAALLVVSDVSLKSLDSRLEGEKAVMEKFRPNIVMDGIKEWDEDFWNELHMSRTGVKILLTSNCARCMSVNVDLDKGRMGIGPSGSLLKSMMRDRRVDLGNKWTPIFGRYGFPTVGGEIVVGDEVLISKRNEERSVWDGIMPRLASLQEVAA